MPLRALSIAILAFAALLAGLSLRTDESTGSSPSVVIESPNPQFNAGFGAPIAFGDVDGDGRDEILAGAPAEDVSGTQDRGRAYLFESDGSLLQTFDSPNGDIDGRFGLRVTMGDVTGDGADELVISAPYEVTGLVRPGRVYVFAASGTLIQTIVSPETSTPVVFGGAVAAGDADGDGAEDIAVMTGDGPGLNGTGYIFSSATWQVIQALVNPAPQGGSYFGHGFAMGDVTGDGLSDVAIGAFREDVGQFPDQGRVHVYSGNSGSLLRSLDLPVPQDFAQFGASLAIGKVDADALEDIVVGANYEDVAGNAFQGRAYVFSGNDGSLIRSIDHPDPQPYGFFGALATGDANGDGRSDVFVVGAAGVDNKVYGFDGVNGMLVDTLVPAIPQLGAVFGRDLGLGNLNSDAGAEIGVAAPLEDVGANDNQGRVYLFDSDADGDADWNALDNCLTTPNPTQTNTDGDALGDACDADDDNDGIGDADEAACGSDPLDVTPPLSRPERVDGVFDGVDDDGDTAVDEALPGGASAFDCDGDGYKGPAEDHVYSYLPQTGGDQKTCQEYDTSHPNPNADITPSKRWPADFHRAGVPNSFNRVNILDLSSFLAPVRYFGTDVGANPGDVRWDLVPGASFPFPMDINIVDLSAMLAGSTGMPPMLGGVRAFGGPVCPWAP